MLSYSVPTVFENGEVLVERYLLLDQEVLKSNIQVKRFELIQEVYPTIETLKQTIQKVKMNFSNLDYHGSKTVRQLELEKRALDELEKHLLTFSSEEE